MLGTSTMNRGGPLSPVSSEYSDISKYQGFENDAPPSPGGPYSRGNLISPPISTASNGMMNGGPPLGRGGRPDSAGGNPSPPASIARSSVGTGSGMYAGSESGKSRQPKDPKELKDENFEGVLSEHYVALKRYLAASLRDEKGNPRPNRARDKLLRLSSVQFQELSTDVFDELLRRQAGGRKGPNGAPVDGGPPPYLLPKDSFHPKRNQARQKLSTLPPPRFRDLATDVFYELERRFPRFQGDDIGRIGSPANSMRGPPGRMGTPVNGMPRPGSRGNDRRRPSDASSLGFPPRGESRNGMRPPMGPNGGLNIPPSPGIPPGDFGRPTPKTFQSNTIVPVKSTMVEDDDDQTGGEDDDDDGDAFGLESAARSRESKRSERSMGGSEADKRIIDDYQSQVAELRERVESMEDTIKLKDDELNSVQETLEALNNDKGMWSELRTELEDKLANAQSLNESLQSELEELRASGGGNGGPADAELKQENEELRTELQEQQEVTEEVRREAQDFLREMRILSERSGSSWEKEQQLENHVLKLEEEVKDWRERYARTKTQLRSMRASSIGLKLQQNASQHVKDSGYTHEDGQVKDVHVTKFQISIDELLQTARSEEPNRVVDYMKLVVANVRRITQDIDESPSNPDLTEKQTKLKSRVSATANNLITATKNFAGARGLSPVSLLDAAASHLTAAIVDLVRIVKIRPTPAGELGNDDDAALSQAGSTGFFPVRQADNDVPPFYGVRNGRQSQESSMYSPVNSPRGSTVRPKSSGKGWGQPESKPPMPKGLNVNGNGLGKALPPAPISPGYDVRAQSREVEDLKIYIEDQTAILVQSIQSLVSSVRSEAGINALSPQIDAIAEVVGKVVNSTENAIATSGNTNLRTHAEPIVNKLADCRQRLFDMADEGERIADGAGESGDAFRKWAGALPPIAFEIARETKELVQRVDNVNDNGGGDEDFS